MRLTTLGAINLDGPPDASRLVEQSKLLTLFAFLVLARRGGYQRRERVAGLFWPDQSEDKARASLRSALRSLRTVLGDDILLKRGDSDVGVDPAKLSCDAFEFEDAIEHGEFALALELYQGPLLDGLYPDSAAVQHWLDERREWYRAAAADAAWALAERYESASGDLTSAARWARRAAKLAGSDERRIRRVMELLARAGDAAGAIAIYNDFARYLERELDVQPSHETMQLAGSIRTNR
jgi:DNA-binding SARP family transcriptional activator